VLLVVRRSETATARQGTARRAEAACVGTLAALFAVLLSSTLDNVEKVRSQFLSLRQFHRSPLFSGSTCWQLSPVVAAISNLGSGLRIGRAGFVFLRMARFSSKLWTVWLWQSYGLANGHPGAHIRRMEKFRSRMLEVSVMLDGPSRWEWQVTSNGEMIANGFEDGQVEAKFEGYNAMFLLLAAGWNP
jgi:hypothetical protein